MAVIIRAVPSESGTLAGELEVVDTGEVTTFADAAELVARLGAAIRSARDL